MSFKLAYLRLTFFYVLIAMTISVIFSLAIYQISSKELGRGLGRQTRFLRELPLNDSITPQFPNLEQIRIAQLEESNNRLKINLIYYNLLILVLSSIASYFLAKRTLQPIEETMEAQKRFTADASHELRTPLAALRTEIEVSLRDKKLNLPAVRKLLRSNLEEIEKLESLSKALLKLARYQEKEKISLEEVSLEEILVEVYEKIKGLANKKSIDFKNSLQDIKIKGDKESLIELFVILLDNAIKYSPKNSKISMTITKVKNHPLVKIKDQGMGIKSSDLPYIFNRFYRADISRSKEKVNGYGLGLSIAKEIAKIHGGKISVISKPGKGSEFTVKF